MAEYLDKTGLAHLWSKIKNITLSGLKVGKMRVNTAAANESVPITADVTGNNKFVCWIGVASVGFIGTPYIADLDKPTTHIFDKNAESGYVYEAFYLEYCDA